MTSSLPFTPSPSLAFKEAVHKRLGSPYLILGLTGAMGAWWFYGAVGHNIILLNDAPAPEPAKSATEANALSAAAKTAVEAYQKFRAASDVGLLLQNGVIAAAIGPVDAEKIETVQTGLKADFTARTEAADIALAFARNARLGDIVDAADALAVIHPAPSFASTLTMHPEQRMLPSFRKCQTSVMALPGFTPSAETRERVIECMEKGGKENLGAILYAAIALAFGAAAVTFGRRSVGISAARQWSREMQAHEAMASPVPVAMPVVETPFPVGLHKDMTVKGPLKLAPKGRLPA